MFKGGRRDLVEVEQTRDGTDLRFDLVPLVTFLRQQVFGAFQYVYHIQTTLNDIAFEVHIAIFAREVSVHVGFVHDEFKGFAVRLEGNFRKKFFDQ